MAPRAEATHDIGPSTDAHLTLELSRVSRAEAVAETLEREIQSRSLDPGAHLGTKDQLRLRFGVALGTINEAVRLLLARGLVTARPGPGGGVFVADETGRPRRHDPVLGVDWAAATLGDCAELRAALEPLIARHAAAQRRPEDIRALELLVDEMQAALDADDADAYEARQWAFHRRVAVVCPNAALKSAYLTLLDLLERGGRSVAAAPVEPDPGQVSLHRAIAAAIASGDGPELKDALEAHDRASTQAA